MPEAQNDVVEAAPPLTDLSADQLKQAGEKAAALLSEDREVNMAAAAIITSLQLYSTARFALHRQLTALGHRWEDGLEACILEAMKAKGQQPFERGPLLEKVTTVITLFLQAEVAREREAAAKQTNFERQAAAAERLATPLALPATSLAPGRPLERGKLYLIVGQGQTVQQYFTELLEALPAQETTALHLADVRQPQILPTGRLFTRTLPRGVWDNVGKQQGVLERRLQEWASVLYEQRCDLVLIDWLPALNTESLTLQTEPLYDLVRRAWNGAQRLRKAAQHLDLAILGALPVDLRSSEEWERLESLLARHHQFKYCEILFLDRPVPPPQDAA